MKIQKKWILLTVCFLLTVGSVWTVQAYKNSQTVAASIITWDSRGEDVSAMQDKLKRWGYYAGNIDGIFGQKTWEAVVYFQEVNGLKVDGFVGPETLEALGMPVAAQHVADTQPVFLQMGEGQDLNEYLLASAIYAEARGEPYLGKVAVGAVIMNRLEDSSFPDTITGVIYQPGAFDCVRDGQISLTPDESAFQAARDALGGWDPSDGALFYWNPDTATSLWIQQVPVIKTIGNHVFGKF